VKGVISIHGVIGSYVDEKGQRVKGVELLDVIAQVKSQPQATSFLAKIGSPGGLVDVGNQIYDYLISIKNSGIPVNTITDSYLEEGGLKYGVGSIATKIFLAGNERMIVDGHEFFIHNPWTQLTGDSKAIKTELKGLDNTEAELRAFYQAHTKISEAGLKGLMDNQTGMDADHAVQLGFATKKITTTKVQAFALIKNNDMSKPVQADDKGLLQHIMAYFKAEVPAPAQAAPAQAAMPLEDGEYKLEDGRVIVVSGGAISEVKPAEQAPADPAAQAAPQAQVDPTIALNEKIAALEGELNTLKAQPVVNVDDKINAALEQFKNTTVAGAGNKPMRAINNLGGQGTPETTTHKTIAMKQREKQEQAKNKTLNGK
jgi:ATP-dependent Clp protease protease subunit